MVPTASGRELPALSLNSVPFWYGHAVPLANGANKQSRLKWGGFIYEILGQVQGDVTCEIALGVAWLSER